MYVIKPKQSWAHNHTKWFDCNEEYLVIQRYETCNLTPNLLIRQGVAVDGLYLGEASTKMMLLAEIWNYDLYFYYK